MRLSRPTGANSVHSAPKFDAPSAGSSENADSVEQVLDFIEFFPAQNVIVLSQLRIGAGRRGAGVGFCTKLSTTSVSQLLQPGIFFLRAVEYTIIGALLSISQRPETAPLFSIIQAAGWPIWPLVVCSILALALVIERFISLTATKVAPPKLLDEALAVSRTAVPTPDVVRQLEENSALGEVLASGLRALNSDPRCSEVDMRASMENTGRVVAHRLERYLSSLATIASAAPLLGLLGTVIGMIEIFGSQSAAGGRHRRQSGAAGARHFGRLVQHRVRIDRGDSVADFLALLPGAGRRIPADARNGGRSVRAPPQRPAQSMIGPQPGCGAAS